MILVTRLNGDEIYINADLIERIEATPDTVLTLVDGRKYVATESPAELIERITAFRAGVLVAADLAHDEYERIGERQAGQVSPVRPLRLLEEHTNE